MTIAFFFALLWIVTGIAGFAAGVGAIAATRRRLEAPTVSSAPQEAELRVG